MTGNINVEIKLIFNHFAGAIQAQLHSPLSQSLIIHARDIAFTNVVPDELIHGIPSLITGENSICERFTLMNKQG